MREDLLKTIRGLSGLSDVLVLTHNIDFLFLQTAVLAALKRGGNPRITIFADAGCAQESFAEQHRLLEGLGVRYRVVAVSMQSVFRFHPKAVLLAGDGDATLFVGSGNLTFGGWCDNAEGWTRFDARTDGPAPFEQFGGYAADIVDRLPLATSIAKDVRRAINLALEAAAEAVPAVPTFLLFGRAGNGAPLLQAMSDFAGAAAIDELVVCSPYFDIAGTALHRLVETFRPNAARILYQPGESTLSAAALAANPGVALSHVGFERQDAEGRTRRAFIHAKFYALLRGDEAIVFMGSANCSVAALLCGGNEGNAELMVAARMTADDFQRHWLEEFSWHDAPVAPPEHVENPEPAPDHAGLQVRAARFVGGRLLVVFAPPGALITTCITDQGEVAFGVPDGVLDAEAPAGARWVRLVGQINGVEAESSLAWVDDEDKLNVSRQTHAAVEALRGKARSGDWKADAWADVLDVFCRHASRLPRRPELWAGPKGAQEREARGVQREYSYADVFADGYEPPRVGQVQAGLLAGGAGHQQSLQALLQQWFAAPEEDAEANGEAAAGEGGIDVDDEEVDRPTRFGPIVENAKRPPPDEEKERERNRKRILRLLANMKKAMTDPRFFASRPADVLAVDLELAAVLLGTGQREGWVAAAEYFDITAAIWAMLFLHGGEDAPEGWVSRRLADPAHGSDFQEALRSPVVSAALLGWALGMGPAPDGEQAARFRMTSALAVARHPWMFRSGDETDIASALFTYLRNAGQHVGEHGGDWVVAEWKRMLQRGQALHEVEAAMRRAGLTHLRELLRSRQVDAGELLWQGKAGYCINRSRFHRDEPWDAQVFRVNDPGNPNGIQPAFALPVAAVLAQLDCRHEVKPAMAALLEDLRGAFHVRSPAGLLTE